MHKCKLIRGSKFRHYNEWNISKMVYFDVFGDIWPDFYFFSRVYRTTVPLKAMYYLLNSWITLLKWISINWRYFTRFRFDCCPMTYISEDFANFHYFGLISPYFQKNFFRKCKCKVETWLRILVERYSSRISISRKIKSHISGLYFVKRHFSLFFGLKFHT